jgi:hypothetical protein
LTLSEGGENFSRWGVVGGFRLLGLYPWQDCGTLVFPSFSFVPDIGEWLCAPIGPKQWGPSVMDWNLKSCESK